MNSLIVWPVVYICTLKQGSDDLTYWSRMHVSEVGTRADISFIPKKLYVRQIGNKLQVSRAVALLVDC